MGIALVRFAPDGGTGRFATHLVRGLVSAGHEVHVACLEAVSTGAVRRGRGSLHLHPVRLPRFGSTSTMILFARAARRQLLAARTDVDLALGRIPGLDIFRAGGGCHDAYLDTVGRRRRTVRHRVERALDRRCVLTTPVVVTNARLPARELVARYGAARERIRVVPNGVDGDRFRPDSRARAEERARLGVPDAAPLVVFLGEGFHRKGLDIAIRCTAGLAGVRLAVVGGDRKRAPYRALARHLGCPLLFLGARRDPERILATADALLLPTRYDAASNAVLEALATGIPAITSGANGAAEFVPAPWMRVWDPEDVEGFRRALSRALAKTRMEVRCREAALRYPWSATCGAFEALLEEAAGSPRGGVP